MNAKLIEQVKKATEIAGWIRECRSDTDIQYLNWCSAIGRLTCQHLPGILALLESCGSATPEQVRAALELSDNILAGDNLADDIIKHKAREGDLVRLADHRKAEAGLLKNYRAAVAQKGGEDE